MKAHYFFIYIDESLSWFNIPFYGWSGQLPPPSPDCSFPNGSYDPIMVNVHTFRVYWGYETFVTEYNYVKLYNIDFYKKKWMKKDLINFAIYVFYHVNDMINWSSRLILLCWKNHLTSSTFIIILLQWTKSECLASPIFDNINPEIQSQINVCFR